MADEEAVAQALAATEITDLADRSVDELSGGQRQRVWIARRTQSFESTESAELTSSPGADSTISSVITPSSMMAA
jgi:ABC-type hemin transport system ATPase subunit